MWDAGRLSGASRRWRFFSLRVFSATAGSSPAPRSMAKKSIEQRVAETMMEVPATVTVGGRAYDVAPPTFGTLELVSALLAKVPDIGDLAKAPNDMKAAAMLQRARDFGVLPEILATLILGSKHIRDKEKVAEKRRKRGLLGLFGVKETVEKEISVADRLAQEIRDEVSPYQMSELVPYLIGSLQLSDFFVLTTFLRGINTAEPTKVVKKATAPGPSSRASSKPSE